MVVYQRVQVAAVGDEIVIAVWPDVGVAEAAQVGRYHLEPGRRQRADHAPPDALRLGPSVNEDHGDAPGTLVHEHVPEAARRSVLGRERVGAQLHSRDASHGSVP